MSLGEEIRRVRKERDLTLKELGSRIGLTHSGLSKIENGKTEVARSTLIALAKELRSNFGEEWLDEYLAENKQKELEDISVEDFVALKFGGDREVRTDEDTLALARFLDSEIERQKKVMKMPVRKPPKKKEEE